MDLGIAQTCSLDSLSVDWPACAMEMRGAGLDGDVLLVGHDFKNRGPQ
jgi:hypothetical protein